MALNHIESIAIVESVISIIETYKEKIRLQHEALAEAISPLTEENASLKAQVTELLEEDAALDAALLTLSRKLAPDPETPVEPEVPTEPIAE